LIESAGAQLAASRYLHARASEKGEIALFKQASALANDARQNELAAWELAAREAKARPRPEGRPTYSWELIGDVQDDEGETTEPPADPAGEEGAR
jgi:hypothetical protein